MKELRVIVCGGRDYSDRERLFEVLDQVHDATPIAAIIHGNARGADTLAGEFAKSCGHGVQCWPRPADWKKHGRAAGPMRNKAMLGMGAGLVIAFPGGRGTADMVRQARRAGVRVMEIQP